MDWLQAMWPQVEAKLKAAFGPKPFSPDLVFDFKHVRGAIDIVETAIENAQKVAEASLAERARDAVVRAGQALASGKPFSFIEEGVFSGMAAPLTNVHLTFPMILRRSLLIAICSHVEHVLRQWCRWLEQEWKLPQLGKKIDKRESDLKQCMRYLRDTAGLDLGDYEEWPEWEAVDTYRIVRNCLAHDGGIIPSDHLPRLATCPHVEVVEPGLLHDEPVVGVLPETCPHAAANARRFFEKLSKISAQAHQSRLERQGPA